MIRAINSPPKNSGPEIPIEPAKEPVKKTPVDPAKEAPIISPKKENIMELQVTRFSSQNDSTLGLLMEKADQGLKFLCFTLEDEYRTVKVYGETRIPAGRYQILLRTEGEFHQKYLAKFGPDFHKGMLWLQNVPNFEYVLIHIGNKDDDTAGCLLVGNTSQENIVEEGFIGASTAAYQRIYPPIAKALLNGEKVWVTYIDYDAV